MLTRARVSAIYEIAVIPSPSGDDMLDGLIYACREYLRNEGIRVAVQDKEQPNDKSVRPTTPAG
jgi:hypothetical protein